MEAGFLQNRKMSPRNIRIKDIARLAGVSIGTVDRVIHNRGEVAGKTKEKIQRILKETSYSPNVMAQVLKSSKRYNIVSLLPEPNETNSYWQKHPIGMAMAVKELDHFPVSLSQINFDLQDEEDFQKKTVKVLAVKPDGVLLAPIFKSESTAFCRQLAKEKIPFIFIDGYIEGTDFLAYVGEDVFRSGKVAGQLTDIITSETDDILIVNIAKNISNILHLENRTHGFLSYFKESGTNKGKKITVNIPDPEPATIKAEMNKILDRNKGLGSIFVSGSKSYLFAHYLKKNGLDSINLIGYDLLDNNVEFLKSGVIRFLIGQRPEEQTYKGIKKLFDYISLNKTPDRIEYLPVDIITSENVDFFIRK